MFPLLSLAFCEFDKSKLDEVKATVSSAGLITIENCKPNDTVRLVNVSYPRGLSDNVNTSCQADLLLWVDKPEVGEPYIIPTKGKTISAEDKGKIYILGDKETCELVACGKKDYLENYKPPNIVTGDILPSFLNDKVRLDFASDHDLDGDSCIDVVVQQWGWYRESYTANPLKNQNKVKARDILPFDTVSGRANILDVELGGHTKPRQRHHIWVRHEKGIELGWPKIEVWGTPGLTPPPGAEY